MNEPITKITSVGNIYTRMMHFEKAGDTEQGHVHQHDHATLLSSGSLRITVNGKSNDYVAPTMIWIAKDLNHELVALEDNTVVACIHGLRGINSIDSELIDPESIPDGAFTEYYKTHPTEPLIKPKL